jgi:hypothetical protein
MVPPHDIVYQYHFALVPRLPPTLFKVVDVPEHIVEGTAVTEVGVTDKVLTFTKTAPQLDKVVPSSCLA